MNKILWSRKTDNWTTPEHLILKFKPTFDPCPLVWRVNGLDISWHGRVLLNPPYSDIRVWIIKATEQRKNCTKLWVLVPARTDTRWFHDLVYKKYDVEFIRGRLKFGNSVNSAPFPSMIIKIK